MAENKERDNKINTSSRELNRQLRKADISVAERAVRLGMTESGIRIWDNADDARDWHKPISYKDGKTVLKAEADTTALLKISKLCFIGAGIALAYLLGMRRGYANGYSVGSFAGKVEGMIETYDKVVAATQVVAE